MEFCFSVTWNDPAHYVPLARAADEHGWWGMACADHIVNPETTRSTYPYTTSGQRRWEPFTPWPDPWVSVAAMAAVTERVRFFTTVYILPARTPFAVAKTVGTAAVLSGNRVGLGVGMGWMEEEFDAMEQPFPKRGRRADEMIEVIRKLWAGGWVEHHGQFYDFDRMEMSPAPSEQPPIYVGGVSDAALRRAARHDGWISDMHTTDEFKTIVAKLRRYRKQAGRAGEPFAVIGSSKDAVDVDGYRRLEEAGVTHLLTWPWVFYSGKTQDLQEKLYGVARFS
ncbi:MAG: TIGR03619 family F420-dependent LLM class oxidoreductase, partial [Acidimicrobiales bacterium]